MKEFHLYSNEEKIMKCMKWYLVHFVLEIKINTFILKINEQFSLEKCIKLDTSDFYDDLKKLVFLLKYFIENSCVEFDAFSRWNSLFFFLKEGARMVKFFKAVLKSNEQKIIY